MSIKHYFPLDIYSPFEIQETAGLAWPVVRALNDVAADLDATRDHAFYAALALVLQRVTGKSELFGRLSLRGRDVMRTFIPPGSSLPEAIQIVRDAETDQQRKLATRNDSLCIVVFGTAGCELSGDSYDSEFYLTLSGNKNDLGHRSREVLAALVALVTIEVARPPEHFPAFRPLGANASPRRCIS